MINNYTDELTGEALNCFNNEFNDDSKWIIIVKDLDIDESINEVENIPVI